MKEIQRNIRQSAVALKQVSPWRDSSYSCPILCLCLHSPDLCFCYPAAGTLSPPYFYPGKHQETPAPCLSSTNCQGIAVLTSLSNSIIISVSCQYSRASNCARRSKDYSGTLLFIRFLLHYPGRCSLTRLSVLLYRIRFVQLNYTDANCTTWPYPFIFQLILIVLSIPR